MYLILSIAGAYQLTRWLFALVDIIERGKYPVVFCRAETVCAASAFLLRKS